MRSEWHFSECAIARYGPDFFIDSQGLSQHLEPKLSATLLLHARTSVREVIARSATLEALISTVTELFSNTETTAWVAASDFIACLIHDYVYALTGQSPRQLGVELVGFDDTLDSFDRGLSSYNFYVAQLFRAMLAHLLVPSRDLTSHKQPKITEISGFVVDRH